MASQSDLGHAGVKSFLQTVRGYSATRGISWQATMTWKGSRNPEFTA
jgi:hypothetical protein